MDKINSDNLKSNLKLILDKSIKVVKIDINEMIKFIYDIYNLEFNYNYIHVSKKLINIDNNIKDYLKNHRQIDFKDNNSIIQSEEKRLLNNENYYLNLNICNDVTKIDNNTNKEKSNEIIKRCDNKLEYINNLEIYENHYKEEIILIHSDEDKIKNINSNYKKATYKKLDLIKVTYNKYLPYYPILKNYKYESLTSFADEDFFKFITYNNLTDINELKNYLWKNKLYLKLYKYNVNEILENIDNNNFNKLPYLIDLKSKYYKCMNIHYTKIRYAQSFHLGSVYEENFLKRYLKILISAYSSYNIFDQNELKLLSDKVKKLEELKKNKIEKNISMYDRNYFFKFLPKEFETYADLYDFYTKIKEIDKSEYYNILNEELDFMIEKKHVTISRLLYFSINQPIANGITFQARLYVKMFVPEKHKIFRKSFITLCDTGTTIENYKKVNLYELTKNMIFTLKKYISKTQFNSLIIKLDEISYLNKSIPSEFLINELKHFSYNQNTEALISKKFKRRYKSGYKN